MQNGNENSTWLRKHSRIQDAHLPPFLPQIAYTNPLAWLASNVLHVQQVVFLSKRKEMREERVEVRLGLKMKKMDVVRVEYVGKHAKQLAVDVFCR